MGDEINRSDGDGGGDGVGKPTSEGQRILSHVAIKVAVTGERLVAVGRVLYEAQSDRERSAHLDLVAEMIDIQQVLADLVVLLREGALKG